MSLRAVLVVLLILLATHGAFSYPGGPPTSICNNSAGVFLRPGRAHGINSQAGNGGFLISTDLPLSEDNTGGYNYTAGRLYTGRLSCFVVKQVNNYLHMCSNQVIVAVLSSFSHSYEV